MLELISIISGSSGNASLVTDGRTRLLIDCGTSGKRLEAALNELHISPYSINALLITHEHSDHIKGAGVVARKYKLPVFATAPTHSAMNIGNLDDSLIEEVSSQKCFEIGTIAVTPFSIPHDAVAPVGYTFTDGSDKVSLATDIGCITDDILSAVCGSSKVILESNHDVEMLRIGPYPYPLKQRILGNTGHLSNKNAASAALKLVNHGTRHIMLGHLSIHNNLPEIAAMETFNALTNAGIKVGSDVTLQVADRYKITRFEC